MIETMSDKAHTYDDGKPPLAWLPWAAVTQLSKVQAYGHEKYKDFNNYRKGMEVSRNASCALRHIRDYLEGSNTDHESGLHPLAHALCRIAFILQNEAEGVAIDDRFIRPKSELDRANERIAVLEGVVEDVACGATITCIKCGKSMPCNCELIPKPPVA